MSQDPTKVYLPASAKFPVEITALLQGVGSPIKKHTPLLRYKYKWKLEKPDQEEEEQENDDENDNENAIVFESTNDGGSGMDSSGSRVAHRRSTSLSSQAKTTKRRRSSLDVQIATQQEAYSTLESPFQGELSEWIVKPGDIIRNSKTPVLYILEPCSHPIQFGGMCAVCGKSLGEDLDYTDYRDDEDRDRIQMSHENNGLTVSYAEAERIEMSLERHLQEQKKLILVVDLDQTVIQATVDPTVSEWMKDPNNPNNSALSDVEKFSLMETIYKPPTDRPGPAVPVKEMCWYYVKKRPGLSYFLEEMNKYYEMHIYTMATKAYACAIAKIIDPEGTYFGDRILSRDDSGSLLHKNLQRLFPVSTSMVAIIDDRGDVWNWCDNLVKVSPFNFFVGIGDINSSFLPQQTDVMKASVDEIISVKDEDQEKDLNMAEGEGEDQSKLSAEKLESNGDRKENGTGEDNHQAEKKDGENTSHETADDNGEKEQRTEDCQGDSKGDKMDTNGGTNDDTNSDIDNSSSRSPAENSNGNTNGDSAGSTSDTTSDATNQYVSDTDLSPQALEDETLLNKRSATLEAQQTERPLQKLQNQIHERKLLKDNDRELVRVENILKHIHSSYYRDLEKGSGSGPTPNLEKIIPRIKSKVLDGCVILFSGVIPLTTKAQDADIVRWTRSFGAVVVFDYVDTITHLVAMSKGTAKVHQTVARKGVDNVHIVKLAWLMSTLAAWERLPEKEFEFTFTPEEIEHIKKTEPLTMGVNDDSGDDEISPDIEGTEDFVQSLKQGDMNWEDIDKELEEFMADDSGDDDDDDNDDDDDEDDDNSENGSDEEDDTSKKRKQRSEDDDSASVKRSKLSESRDSSQEDEEGDDDDDDDDSSIDHDFLRELEKDLM